MVAVVPDCTTAPGAIASNPSLVTAAPAPCQPPNDFSNSTSRELVVLNKFSLSNSTGGFTALALQWIFAGVFIFWSTAITNHWIWFWKQDHGCFWCTLWFLWLADFVVRESKRFTKLHCDTLSMILNKFSTHWWTLSENRSNQECFTKCWIAKYPGSPPTIREELGPSKCWMSSMPAFYLKVQNSQCDNAATHKLCLSVPTGWLRDHEHVGIVGSSSIPNVTFIADSARLLWTWAVKFNGTV